MDLIWSLVVRSDDASDPVNIGGGIYSIAAIPIDASAGTYTLPRVLAFICLQDYCAISLAAKMLLLLIVH